MTQDFILETEDLFAEQGNVFLEHLVLCGEFSGSAFETVDVLLFALPALVCSDAVLLEMILASR